jgi:hypothetical protein
MGSNHSNQDFDYNTLGTDTLNQTLTKNEIFLLKSSWDLIKNNPEVGMAVMIR